MTELTWFFIGLAVVQLVIGAAVVLFRLAKGPTALDRVVAADVIVAILIAAVAAQEMVDRTDVGLPILLVLTMVGFTTAVGMARLTAGSRARDERYRNYRDQNGGAR